MIELKSGFSLLQVPKGLSPTCRLEVGNLQTAIYSTTSHSLRGAITEGNKKSRSAVVCTGKLSSPYYVALEPKYPCHILSKLRSSILLLAVLMDVEILAYVLAAKEPSNIYCIPICQPLHRHHDMSSFNFHGNSIRELRLQEKLNNFPQVIQLLKWQKWG